MATDPRRVEAMAAALMALPGNPYPAHEALAAAADLEAVFDAFLQHTPLGELLAPRRLPPLRRAEEVLIHG